MTRLILILICVLGLSGCDLFDYHPYDGRLNTTANDLNNSAIGKIENEYNQNDTIRFVWFGDSGRSLDEMKMFVKHINQNPLIDFAIHAGDITEFGLKKEFEWAHDILKKLNMPYVALIGNHDILGNGHKVFEKIYGNDNFGFIANGILFLGLNTNALEYDYHYPVPDFSFIKSQFERTGYTRTIVTMHAEPGCEQFNNNIAELFQEKLREFPNLLFCLNGHTHNFDAKDIFDDGVIYYTCDDIGKRSYLLFTIAPDNSYTYELVKY